MVFRRSLGECVNAKHHAEADPETPPARTDLPCLKPLNPINLCLIRKRGNDSNSFSIVYLDDPSFRNSIAKHMIAIIAITTRADTHGVVHLIDLD